MATFNGDMLTDERLVVKVIGGVQSVLPIPSVTATLIDTVTSINGIFVNQQPISELWARYSGDYLFSYFEDYYNHVYVIPTTLDFGTISTATYQTVTVWNAYLRPQRLSSITPPTDTSITYSGIVTPINFKALEMKNVRVLAAAQGSAVVNTNMYFNFDGLEPVRLSITGIRARFWEWVPNWSQPVSTVLEFKTDIFESRSGKEQRSALRDFPRRKINFSALSFEGSAMAFKSYAAKWFSRPALIPNYSQSVRLTEAAMQGDAFIELDEVPVWVTPQTNIILQRGDQVEIKSVLNVSGNRINLTATLSKSWAVGTQLYYGVSGRLANDTKVTAHTSRALEIDVKFDGDAGGEFWPEVGAPERMYEGYELFMRRPNFAASLQIDISQLRDLVDFGHGRTFQYIPANFMSETYQNEYHCYTQDETWALVDFFRRMKGQQGEFYAPTWTEDIRMMVPTVPNTANIRVKGIQFAADFADSTMHKHLMISLNDGRQLFRKVHQIFEVDDSIGHDSNIQVTEAWNEEITTDRVNHISWVMRYRLASDGITISQRTSDVAIINLSMKTLEVLD